MLDLLPYLALGSLRSLLALASILQMIVSISDGVTMNGFLGKCLMFVPYCMCFYNCKYNAWQSCSALSNEPT